MEVISSLFIIIVVILLLLYLFAVKGRIGCEELSALRGWAYAHRGLHGNGVAENSLTAFSNARDAGYGAELDVHLLKDGQLAVIHDSDLKRTTGKEGKIEDLTEQQLSEYSLENTTDTIPTLSQVLEVFSGKTPLIIELKSQNNVENLCRRVCDILDTYDGMFCLESFDPRCVFWLRKNRPDIIRGQLTENYFRSKTSKLPWILKFVLKHQFLNFLTLPDFVAYKFDDRKTISNVLCRKIWHMQGVTWTLRTKDAHDLAVQENWIPIFENYLP